MYLAGKLQIWLIIGLMKLDCSNNSLRDCSCHMRVISISAHDRGFEPVLVPVYVCKSVLRTTVNYYGNCFSRKARKCKNIIAASKAFMHILD